MTTLAVKYRPKKFSEVVGQTDLPMLRYILASGEPLPPVILLCGPSGVGKTTVARISAAFLNCENPLDKEPCSECPSCVRILAGNDLGVHELDAAFFGKADDMRKLKDLSLTSTSSAVTVMILDEVQALSPQAWNVCLKLFEEPVENTVFFLVTSEPNKIPAKIRTRSIRFNFHAVSPVEISTVLSTVMERETITVDNLDPIINLCSGSPRDALMMLEQVHLSGQTAEEVLGIRDISVPLLYCAVKNDKVAGVQLINNYWENTGDARALVESLCLAMEKSLHIRYNIHIYSTEAQMSVLEEVSSALDDTQWASGMECLAEWESKCVTKSHALFMWVAFLKSMHGASVPTLTPRKSVVDEDLQPEEFESLLKGMKI